MTGNEEIMGWRLTRWRAWVLVVAVWGLIYLPGLGDLELRGNEAKRILPALHMLESGNWITPQLAGEKYFNKPPLMYWMIALSFWATGTREEWAARLPSVLAVLVFVTLLIWRGRAWLALRGRLCAALIFMTVVSFIEKGRSSEIEASFVSVTGWAIWWWLNTWAEYRDLTGPAAKGGRIRLWLPVSLIIGLGLLLKGPLLLVFVYVPILSVLMYERRWREFWTWQHGVGVVVWAGMLLTWVGACKLDNVGASPATVWREEMGSRFALDEVTFITWLGNIGKVFIDFLPWTVFLPLVWWPGVRCSLQRRDERVYRALRLALVICFGLVNMLPGTRPRYSMPLFASASLLLGWALACDSGDGWLVGWWVRVIKLAAAVWVIAVCGALMLGPTGLMSTLLRTMHAPFHVPPPAQLAGWVTALFSSGVIVSVAIWVWRHAHRIRNLGDCVVATSGYMATGVLAFSVFLIPFFSSNAIRRHAGAAIASVVPSDVTLHVYARPDLRETGYQPFLYYVPRRLVFITNVIDVGTIPYVLTPSHHTNAWLSARTEGEKSWGVLTNILFKDDALSVLGVQR